MKLWRTMAILALALAWTGAAEAADKLRVGKGVPFAWTFIAVDVGQEIGLWDKYGIDVEIIGFGGAARQQQALIAGSVDIGLGSGPSMGFTAKGAPAHGVAAFAGPPLSISIVVSKDSPIKSVTDLKGAKMGVTTAGSLTDWLTKRVAMTQGWGPEGIKSVALGGLEPSLAALKTKQVDALMLATEVGYQLEEKGETRNVANAGRFVTDFHTHVMFARDALIASNPDLVQRFVNGWFSTIAYMKANRAHTVDISMRVLKLSRGVLERTYDEEMPMMSDDGVFDPKALAVLKPSLVEMGIVEKLPRDDEMFTSRFVPAKVERFVPRR
jgi:ABC-type nitrate/sulfonate/bicarbonate transport system substrate-binding protein